MNKEKLENIEITLAHQEQLIQDLNEVTTNQWKQIDVLTRRLDMAIVKIEQLEGGGKGENNSLSSLERAVLDKPPHY